MCGKKKKHGRETKKKEKGENYDSVLNGGRSIRTKYKVYKVQSTKKKRNERRESDEEIEITHIEERNSPAWNELLCGTVRALCREGDSDCSTVNKVA